MNARASQILKTFGVMVAVIASSACSRNATTYSGTLQAEAPNVGSTVGGRVIAVLVADGQRVSKGQVLLRFDPKDQRAALAQAQGTLAQAQSTLADLQAGPRPEDLAKANAQAAQARHVYEQAAITAPHQIDEAKQTVHQTQAAASVAAHDAERAARLFHDGAISAQAYDAAFATSRQAQAQLRAAQAQLAAMRSGTAPQGVQSARQAYEAALANAQLIAAGTRPDQVAQAEGAVRTAQAGVQAAQARLAEMTVRAPADGIINSLDLRAGDLVPAGAAVASVEEFKDPFVRIYVPQANLGELRIGQSVSVRSDALPKQSFTGRIESIDSSAQFTPRDVQTAEDRANLVFGVKVRVRDPDRVLRGGTTVEVGL
jgi:HlyD family secretion protein